MNRGKGGGRGGEREEKKVKNGSREGRKKRKEGGREVSQKLRCNVHCTGLRTNLSFELGVTAGNELCQMSYCSRIHHCLG